MLNDERQVIGCIFTDNEALYGIHSWLRPQMFTSAMHQDMYAAMLNLYDAGKPINAATVMTALESKYNSDILISEMSECVSRIVTATEVTDFAKRIINEHKAKMVRSLFDSTDLLAGGVDKSIDGLIDNLESLRNTKKSSLKDLSTIVAENKQEYFNGKDKKRIRTGFFKLDEILGGLEGGDVTVIGARPAVGKSALVTQIIGQVANKGFRVGYYNLEMNESQVYERMLSKFGLLKLSRIRRAKDFIDNEKEKFDTANEKLSKLNIMVSTGSKKVSEIKAECRHQKFDLIVIDYLQLIRADRNYSNRASEVGDISKSIKALAMELHVPIILLSQLNRVSEQRTTKEPTMSELRESGDIEQDASQIILMWNMSDKLADAKGMVVCKNRMGELGKIGFKFNGENMDFDERMEDFSKWEHTVMNLEKGLPEFADDGFANINADIEEDIPFV